MTQETTTLLPMEQAELQSVAHEMAQAYKRMVEFYIRECGLSRKEALERQAHQSERQEWIEEVKQMPARQLSWSYLGDLENNDPQAALQKWEQVKAEARDYLETGGMPADVLGASSPWERAKYFAVRADFIRDWEPRNGIESCLIDQMALCSMRFLEWNAALSNWAGFADFDTKKDVLPRITAAEAIERSAGMIDRFNRLFLRTLRALRDLRRYSAPVIVQNAGQVNVAAAGGQQVNVAPKQGTDAEPERIR